jgi:hypothetical protein
VVRVWAGASTSFGSNLIRPTPLIYSYLFLPKQRGQRVQEMAYTTNTHLGKKKREKIIIFFRNYFRIDMIKHISKISQFYLRRLW